MGSLSAVPYRQFIEVLWMLDAYTPFFPADADVAFVIFRSAGSGYYPTPTPPCYTFVSKDPDTLVPAFEISKALKGLEISKAEFLEMLNKCPRHAENSDAEGDYEADSPK